MVCQLDGGATLGKIFQVRECILLITFEMFVCWIISGCGAGVKCGNIKYCRSVVRAQCSEKIFQVREKEYWCGKSCEYCKRTTKVNTKYVKLLQVLKFTRIIQVPEHSLFVKIRNKITSPRNAIVNL